ncbi:scavenger receptor class F member 1 isoform X2 [Betta splendens]|uniref:Scavenger receptor class F member 1 isoform X2 n=1 Tax=Betta splendens TaxID=158456 RepID=A0A9W2Y8H6_BETSP|nr:scavenger receptor class F member 1 isoform X2 [Betta splendens]
MKLLLGALGALLCCSLSSSQTLDPAGKNVCLNARDPSTPACCTGWRQEGNACTIPVCEGDQACHKNEICVYPGVCHCPPGYFGARCRTPCPLQLWGSNCRQECRCFPHGRCHPVTGECSCRPNRWGPLCQHACTCARYGQCHPVHGNCTCDEGWWTAACSKPCLCVAGGSSGPGCDQATGQCRCHRGHWGQRCLFNCSCHLSPCDQRDGACECEAGWWGLGCGRKCNCDLRHSHCDPGSGRCLCHPGYQGSFCNRLCENGTYGSGCDRRCGHCTGGRPCSLTDGSCAACEPGWNGTRCDRPCPPGYYGDGCRETCPRCRSSEPCDPVTGTCPRCDEACSNRTFGLACSFLCGPCFHGNCHHVTGRCICQPGFHGESCNSSCPHMHFGPNCSSVCACGGGASCHPLTGVCPHSGRTAVLVGVLLPLLLLLLAVLCCCLCCGGSPVDSKDRATLAEGGWSARMKYHVYSVVANISAALPCVSNWSSGLPRVTVSHHDPELTFNHSFIEPPSSGWVTEGSSFDSDEEEGEALYCVPPREDIPAVAGGEFQEMSSKCNMFLDPSGFSSEDISSPFNIPRTSSIAKSKRPSVSFAEGTRFGPKERRGSAQDPCVGVSRSKSKTNWGVLMLSALQSQGSAARTEEEGAAEGRETVNEGDVQVANNQEANCDAVEQEDRTSSRASMQVHGGSGRRRTMSNTAAHKGTQLLTPASDTQVGGPNKVTTVYVTVGRAGRPVSKTEPSSEGPVQAMLRRLGSLQRQREQESGKAKSRRGDEITKPPRRKLGARATVWEQGGPHGAEGGPRKPVRRKQGSVKSPDAASANDAPLPDSDTPRRPLSSILKYAPEPAPAEPGAALGAEGNSTGQTESNYLTVGPAGDAVSLTEIIANEGANDEPCYENVLVKGS